MNRACPICGTVSRDSFCKQHGKNVRVFTRTLDELVAYLMRHDTGTDGVRLAVGNLLEAEKGRGG